MSLNTPKWGSWEYKELRDRNGDFLFSNDGFDESVGVRFPTVSRVREFREHRSRLNSPPKSRPLSSVLWAMILQRKHRNEDSRRCVVQKAPTSRLRYLLEFIYTEKAYKRVFQNTLDDIDYEYVKALTTENQLLRRWVVLRGYLMVFVTIVHHAITSQLREILG